jgi:predicted nucleotidyltransferase
MLGSRSPSRRVSIAGVHAAAGRIAPRFGLRLIVAFGSQIRSAAADPQDLDLAVVGSTPIDTIALTNAFIRALGFQNVDLVDLRRADPLLLALVAREGVPLYEAESGVFAEFCSLAIRRYHDTAKFRAAERDVVRSAVGLDGPE